MDRQELAESMAEFLGWTTWGKDKIYGALPPDRVDYIFSPDGFFAVWDNLDKKLDGSASVCFYPTKADGQFEVTMLSEFNEVISKLGPDRYTAFYSAIHEMRTKK